MQVVASLIDWQFAFCYFFLIYMSKKIAVVAIGGNALIKDNRRPTVLDQYLAAKEVAHHIANMIKEGWRVVVVHGNGPQVGFILRRSEIAEGILHPVPLDACVADTQGALGYALQQNLQNHFHIMGLNRTVATIVTQVEVRADDVAFDNPLKPIGSFLTEEKATEYEKTKGWSIMNDAGRGWRRVVASPLPIRIVEMDVIQTLIDAGVVVIAAGGGGIPVVSNAEGTLKGVAAVIDKDHAAAMLANQIGAERLIISTGVEKVALHFGTPNQQWLDQITLEEARHYLNEGTHFEAGSMAPKMWAVVNYLERGGTKAIITDPPNIDRAINGETGTHISV